MIRLPLKRHIILLDNGPFWSLRIFSIKNRVLALLGVASDFYKLLIWCLKVSQETWYRFSRTAKQVTNSVSLCYQQHSEGLWTKTLLVAKEKTLATSFGEPKWIKVLAGHLAFSQPAPGLCKSRESDSLCYGKSKGCKDLLSRGCGGNLPLDLAVWASYVETLYDTTERSFILSQCAQSLICAWLCDPMDWGTPGSSVHEVFQARTVE